MTSIVQRGCDALDRLVQSMCRWILYITMVTLFGVLTVNVILRYVAGTSMQWAGEIPELVFPWMVMAGVVLASQYGSHISIVWLTEKFSASLLRWIKVGHAIALMAGYATLAWGTWTLIPIVHSEHSHVLGVPTSVTYGCMLAGFAAMVLTAFTQGLRSWLGLAATTGSLADSN
jgi:TRAP-type C4-dicarboxylate transport system permease small subunit